MISSWSESLRISDRTFQWFLFSRRKSMESKTSPLRISRAVGSSPSAMRSSKWQTLLAWQLSLPRWMSERMTASDALGRKGEIVPLFYPIRVHAMRGG